MLKGAQVHATGVGLRDNQTKPPVYPMRIRSSILALLSLSPFLSAGEVTETTTTTTVMEEKAAPSAFSGTLGVTFASQYILRGLVYENQGAIGQPALDLSYTFFERDGAFNKLSLELGLWSSIHSNKTDAAPGSTTPTWYEFDYTVGLAMTFARYFTFTPTFLTYTSPNDGFDTFHGLNLQLDIDDSEWLGAFALNPHFAYLRELDNKAGSGTRPGNYFEVGVAPGLPEMGPVSVSFPLTAGFGSGEFYEDNTGFGYFSAGVDTSVALGFIPENYGKWAVSAGVTYYYLNGSLATYNVPNTRSAGHNEFVFSGGLSVSF